MARVASLGMYDLPLLHDANDRLWSAVAARLREAGLDHVPAKLDRTTPLDQIWSDPGLILAQTCGYPLMTAWRGRLQYVATPRYLAPGCVGARHRSRIVVRLSDGLRTLRACQGHRVAVNDLASNSGMNLLRAAVARVASGRPFFSDVIMTGSHAASALAVAEGSADVAAIDAVTFAHLERALPQVTQSLLTIAWSVAAPNLPFVTSADTPPAIVTLLRRSLRDAIAVEPDAATTLGLGGIENIGLRRYETILGIEQRAIRAGYPRLH